MNVVKFEAKIWPQVCFSAFDVLKVVGVTGSLCANLKRVHVVRGDTKKSKLKRL